jgi:hypothetical protein
MRALAGRYPNYRWERNVGYCTLAHLNGLAEHGVTPHHRRSFIPVRQLSLDFDLRDSRGEIDMNVLASLIPTTALGDDPDSAFTAEHL